MCNQTSKIFFCAGGAFGKSDWICIPASGFVVELVIDNKDAFQYGFQVPKKNILRRLVVNLFPESFIMVISYRYDADFHFLDVGRGRICHSHL